MKYIFLSFYLLILSCSYPDIDSVPDFKNLDLSKDESIELCKLTSKKDNGKFVNCIANLYDNEIMPNFKFLNISEEYSVKLCKLIYSDRKKLLSCLSDYYIYQDNK